MRAVIIDKPGSVRVGNVPDPAPEPDELIIRVGACGICGTDLHIAEGEFPPTPYPIVPGHEFAGEIVAMGSNIPQGIGTKTTKLTVGTRVAIDPSLFCGHCDFCRAGHGNLCLNWGAIGDTVDGAFAEYVRVPAANAYVLPDNISLQEAGLILMQLALRGGASRVAVVDLNTQRLERAAKLGASNVQTDINKLLENEPLGFDCVIDVTGVARAMEGAFAAVKRGGKFMVFGVAPQEARMSLSPFRIYNDEITVLGSMAVLFSYGPALDLISGGVIDTKALLTTALPLEDFPNALNMVRKGEGVKTQILPNG